MRYLIQLAAWLAYLVATVSGTCSPLSFSAMKVRSAHPQVKAIELMAHTKIDYNAMSYFSLAFQPPLKMEEDYEIDYLKPENSMSILLRQHKHENITLFAIVLKPGKTWLKDPNGPKDLHLTGASVCSTYSESLSNTPTPDGVNLRIATFHGPTQHHCPTLPNLPGATPELTAFLKETLTTCANLRIFKSSKLVSHHVNSFSLLLPNMALILVDANDQRNITDAARSVDTFLASHSVLDIVWEPYSDDEPKWFVLIPRPRGMPGHLFAMMDQVQWHHPLVTSRRGVTEPQCSVTNLDANCIMGCPNTFLARMTGSGWGADSWHSMLDARRALMYDLPVQAAPLGFDGVKLGGPNWRGQFGWTYTYGGCPTNMLDCYFLDHSPCPLVTIDPYRVLKDGNRSRVKAWNTPGIRNIDDQFGLAVDKWWGNVFTPYLPEHRSEGSDLYIPDHSSSHRGSPPAEQVFGSLFWRPKYHLRKETQRRVSGFNMNEPCAAMHVRRSDVVHHRGQSRSYIRVESYIRAARPVMDALGVKTIVLFTDSGSAIEEAVNCTKDYPDVCEGIKFRFIEKKRWYGAEGGWENHLPSGDPQLELYYIQMELTLATKCSMIITGSSSYGDKLKAEMCCGFPLHERGHLPKRCICPPHIQAEPRGFGSCEEGNLLLCKNMTIDAATFTQENIAKPARKVNLMGAERTRHSYLVDNAKKEDLKTMYDEYIRNIIKENCRKYDHGPRIPPYCSKYMNSTLLSSA